MAIVINGSGTVTGISVGGLPDGIVDAGTLATNSVDSAELIDGAIDASHLASGVGGITVADQWRLTTSFQGDAAPIASNWEVADTTGWGGIGSAMTESSGVFTFSSTGIWKVELVMAFTLVDSHSRYAIATIYGTTNNSSYAEWASSPVSLYDSDLTTYASTYASFLVDVTDTSNVKVRFHSSVYDDNSSTLGNTSKNETFATFIRLGDT